MSSEVREGNGFAVEKRKSWTTNKGKKRKKNELPFSVQASNPQVEI
jgi:hypothetical protein